MHDFEIYVGKKFGWLVSSETGDIRPHLILGNTQVCSSSSVLGTMCNRSKGRYCCKSFLV
jgi:hypothetical protein